MLDKNVREFLRNIGRKGGIRRSQLHKDRISEWGKKGGLTKAENERKKISEAYNENYKKKQGKKKGLDNN